MELALNVRKDYDLNVKKRTAKIIATGGAAVLSIVCQLSEVWR